MEYNKEWEYGTPVDCDCENNFIHIDCGCKPKEVCECENILLEISKLKTQDTVLQREIDAISGASISGVTEEQLNEAIASAKTEIEAEIPSLSGYATEQWVEDKHYITGVDLSDYALKSEIPVVPTSNTAFTNDAGYITGVDLSNYATLEDIPTVPTNVSAFVNDASYVTTSELLQYISNLQQQINSLVASISGCCGSSGETQYRWITMTGENDYWCSGTTKMSEEKEQSSTDGLTWVDTGNIRNGETVLQTDCEQCGYMPQNTKVMFILNNGNVQYKECDEYPEVRNMDVHYLIDFNNIKTVYISECANAIGGMAFVSISGLTYVSMPNTITSIGSSAFFGCSSLDNVVIPSGVTSIGMHAFSGCTSLTSIVIPDGVETLSGYVFADCTALEDVTIGTGCTNIENRMFENCTNLQSVTVKAITPPAMQDAFYHTNDSFIIYVPAQSLNAYKTAPGWSTYSSRIQAIV